MTRTRHAPSGILPLGRGGKKKIWKLYFIRKYCQQNQSIWWISSPPHPKAAQSSWYCNALSVLEGVRSKTQKLVSDSSHDVERKLKWWDKTLMILFGTITYQDPELYLCLHLLSCLCKIKKRKAFIYRFLGNILIISTSCLTMLYPCVWRISTHRKQKLDFFSQKSNKRSKPLWTYDLCCYISASGIYNKILKMLSRGFSS